MVTKGRDLSCSGRAARSARTPSRCAFSALWLDSLGDLKVVIVEFERKVVEVDEELIEEDEVEEGRSPLGLVASPDQPQQEPRPNMSATQTIARDAIARPRHGTFIGS